MSLLPKSIANWWHHLTDEGKTLLDDNTKAVWEFLSPTVHDIIRNGGPLLIAAATKAVVAAQAAGGDNSTKLNAARKMIENEIKADVPILETNAVNAVIAAAVAKLHAPDPTAAPPADVDHAATPSNN